LGCGDPGGGGVGDGEELGGLVGRRRPASQFRHML
jgi:hypothetical protein